MSSFADKWKEIENAIAAEGEAAVPPANKDLLPALLKQIVSVGSGQERSQEPPEAEIKLWENWLQTIGDAARICTSCVSSINAFFLFHS